MAKNAPHPAPAAPTPPAPHRIRQSFAVPFEYDVIFARDVLASGSPALADAIAHREPQRCHRVLPILDGGLEAAWPELRGWLAAYFQRHPGRLALAGDPASIVGGEAAKNDPRIVTDLRALFHRQRLDRHAFVLAIGGGAVQDAVGYAAATTHRGLRIVRMPTTVLSQNDSGVGVKNGVNLHGAKNFVGTFAPPFAVVNDARYLERLPARDRIAGLAEAVKVALIRDADFFARLESQADALAALDADATEQAIARCAELHLAHIAGGGDPFEQGSARPLDFGHWAAHKLESLTAHELRHGEAVAIGMTLDSRYAVEAGLLGEQVFERIFRLLGALRLPRWHDALDDQSAGRRALLEGLDDFREHLGGDLTITLLRDVGRPVDVHQMRPELIERALRWMHQAVATP